MHPLVVVAMFLVAYLAFVYAGNQQEGQNFRKNVALAIMAICLVAGIYTGLDLMGYQFMSHNDAAGY